MKFIVKLITNKYLLTLVGITVWLLFFDKNALPAQIELTKQLNKLKAEKGYYVQEIENNRFQINELQTNATNLEKFAREKYLMKKDNEDVFVIIKK